MPERPCRWVHCNEEGTEHVGFLVPMPNGEAVMVYAQLCAQHAVVLKTVIEGHNN